MSTWVRAGSRFALRALLVAVVTAGVVVACGESPLEPVEEVTVVTRDGFEIFANVTPARASRGDEVVVSSQIVRVASTTRSASVRICGLDFQTVHDFPDPGGGCLGHSAEATMMPGDTITQADAGVVDWPRGEHRIRVRHLLQPEHWVELTVVVE